MLYTLMLTSMHSLGEDVLLLMKMEKTLEKIARFNYITNEQLISPPKKRGIELLNHYTFSYPKLS